MDLSPQAYQSCELCPRRCGAARSQDSFGVCGVGAQLKVARAALHFWEEPPISGEAGSGTIFFSGCPLRCAYCQNAEISLEGFGEQVSTHELVAMMCDLERQGALNINLVTALHYAPQVRAAILIAREQGMSLPIVCNTSGYERAELVDAMADVVDIWLTDFKYASAELAYIHSGVRDYPEVAAAALEHMCAALSAAGGRKLDEDGHMLRGVIVRHLVLPGCTDDSLRVLDRVAEVAGTQIDLSVMNQYTPNKACKLRGGDLARTLSTVEYERVLDYADELGFEQLWWQEGSAASESFIPPFDLTGVSEVLAKRRQEPM